MRLAKQPTPPTPAGDRKLSEVARHLVLPAGIETTGWPAVRDTCAKLKVTFDRWQDGAGRAILAKRADGLYAADAVVISIPRQVGKTFLVAWIIFALCIIKPGLTVIWTAHRFKTARETFDSLRAMAGRRELVPHIDKDRITTAAGNESIPFRNGSRILFGARERGFGRGFTRVDVLVADEAQILSSNAMDDMVPATNQATNPLVFLMGTPPKPSDPGEMFTAIRDEAIRGGSEDTLYIEMSADEDADPTDREQWAKANPSYPARTSARAILRMRKHLTPESFLREGLGIWDPAVSLSVFTPGAWARCVTQAGPPPPAALGVASDLDQIWLSLGASSAGEVPHLGSVLRVRADQYRAGFVSEVKRIQGEHGCAVAVDVKGPASFLIGDLEEADVRLTRTGLEDFVQACADIRAAVENHAVSHGNYTDLNDAVDAAGWRTIGDRRVFARKNGDISMLEAVTLAHHGYMNPTKPAAKAWAVRR
jgi:hypothetical protein